MAVFLLANHFHLRHSRYVDFFQKSRGLFVTERVSDELLIRIQSSCLCGVVLCRLIRSLVQFIELFRNSRSGSGERMLRVSKYDSDDRMMIHNYSSMRVWYLEAKR